MRGLVGSRLPPAEAMVRPRQDARAHRKQIIVPWKALDAAGRSWLLLLDARASSFYGGLGKPDHLVGPVLVPASRAWTSCKKGVIARKLPSGRSQRAFPPESPLTHHPHPTHTPTETTTTTTTTPPFATMAGPIVGSPAATVSKPFKQPFKAVAQLSQKTGQLTKPIDPAISKSLDFIYTGITVRVCADGMRSSRQCACKRESLAEGMVHGGGHRAASVQGAHGSREGGSSCASPYPPPNLTILAQTPTDQSRPPQKAKTTVDKVPKVNPYLLAAAGLAVSGLLSLMLVIPALIFFPVTIFFGIVRSYLDRSIDRGLK